MNKRLILTAFIPFALVCLLGMPIKSGAQVLIPKTALAIPVTAQPVAKAPVIIAPSGKEGAELHHRPMWHFRLSADFGPVQTNAIGAQGHGDALSFAFTAQSPGHHFANTLSFTRYNTEIPVLQYCPTCGGFYIAEDENDDYIDIDDVLDWLWGERDCRWGPGVSYIYYHPIYEIGGYNMSGVGFGVDMFPSDRKYYSLYTHDYYYPSVTGSYNNQTSGGFQILRYDAGLNVHPDKSSGLSYQLGLKGENWIGKGLNSRYNELNPYLGVSWSRF
jgi:hypothetical protein